MSQTFEQQLQDPSLSLLFHFTYFPVKEQIGQGNLKPSSNRVFFVSTFSTVMKVLRTDDNTNLYSKFDPFLVWSSFFAWPKYKYQSEAMPNLTFIPHTVTSESSAEKMLWNSQKTRSELSLRFPYSKSQTKCFFRKTSIIYIFLQRYYILNTFIILTHTCFHESSIFSRLHTKKLQTKNTRIFDPFKIFKIGTIFQKSKNIVSNILISAKFSKKFLLIFVPLSKIPVQQLLNNLKM